MEPNIPYDSKAVSTELYEKFNSDIRTTFKNQTTDQTIKQIYLSEVMGNLQYSFSMDQLETWKKSTPTGWANITQILKISINLICLTGFVLKRARRKLIWWIRSYSNYSANLAVYVKNRIKITLITGIML